MFILKPVHLAVCRSDLLLCLRVQAGKCAALPSGGGRAYHLFCEERNYPLGDCASHKPPGIADAGGLDAGQTARSKCGDKKISERIRM